MIFFFGNHMKANQTFPKQMKDCDQEQSEDEAEVLKAVVIQSNPRPRQQLPEGENKLLLWERTSPPAYVPVGVTQPQVGYRQGKVDAWRFTRLTMAEQALPALPWLYPAPVGYLCRT